MLSNSQQTRLPMDLLNVDLEVKRIAECSANDKRAGFIESLISCSKHSMTKDYYKLKEQFLDLCTSLGDEVPPLELDKLDMLIQVFLNITSKLQSPLAKKGFGLLARFLFNRTCSQNRALLERFSPSVNNFRLLGLRSYFDDSDLKTTALDLSILFLQTFPEITVFDITEDRKEIELLNRHEKTTHARLLSRLANQFTELNDTVKGKLKDYEGTQDRVMSYHSGMKAAQEDVRVELMKFSEKFDLIVKINSQRNEDLAALTSENQEYKMASRHLTDGFNKMMLEVAELDQKVRSQQGSAQRIVLLEQQVQSDLRAFDKKLQDFGDKAEVSEQQASLSDKTQNELAADIKKCEKTLADYGNLFIEVNQTLAGCKSLVNGLVGGNGTFGEKISSLEAKIENLSSDVVNFNLANVKMSEELRESLRCESQEKNKILAEMNTRLSLLSTDLTKVAHDVDARRIQDPIVDELTQKLLDGQNKTMKEISQLQAGFTNSSKVLGRLETTSCEMLKRQNLFDEQASTLHQKQNELTVFYEHLKKDIGTCEFNLKGLTDGLQVNKIKVEKVSSDLLTGLNQHSKAIEELRQGERNIKLMVSECQEVIGKQIIEQVKSLHEFIDAEDQKTNAKLRALEERVEKEVLVKFKDLSIEVSNCIETVASKRNQIEEMNSTMLDVIAKSNAVSDYLGINYDTISGAFQLDLPKIITGFSAKERVQYENVDNLDEGRTIRAIFIEMRNISGRLNLLHKYALQKMGDEDSDEIYRIVTLEDVLAQQNELRERVVLEVDTMMLHMGHTQKMTEEHYLILNNKIQVLDDFIQELPELSGGPSNITLHKENETSELKKFLHGNENDGLSRLLQEKTKAVLPDLAAIKELEPRTEAKENDQKLMDEIGKMSMDAMSQFKERLDQIETLTNEYVKAYVEPEAASRIQKLTKNVTSPDEKFSAMLFMLKNYRLLPEKFPKQCLKIFKEINVTFKGHHKIAKLKENMASDVLPLIKKNTEISSNFLGYVGEVLFQIVDVTGVYAKIFEGSLVMNIIHLLRRAGVSMYNRFGIMKFMSGLTRGDELLALAIENNLFVPISIVVIGVLERYLLAGKIIQETQVAQRPKGRPIAPLMLASMTSAGTGGKPIHTDDYNPRSAVHQQQPMISINPSSEKKRFYPDLSTAISQAAPPGDVNSQISPLSVISQPEPPPPPPVSMKVPGAKNFEMLEETLQLSIKLMSYFCSRPEVATSIPVDKLIEGMLQLLRWKRNVKDETKVICLTCLHHLLHIPKSQDYFCAGDGMQVLISLARSSQYHEEVANTAVAVLKLIELKPTFVASLNDEHDAEFLFTIQNQRRPNMPKRIQRRPENVVNVPLPPFIAGGNPAAKKVTPAKTQRGLSTGKLIINTEGETTDDNDHRQTLPALDQRSQSSTKKEGRLLMKIGKTIRAAQMAPQSRGIYQNYGLPFPEQEAITPIRSSIRHNKSFL